MLQSAEALTPRNGRIEGGFDRREAWIPLPVDPNTEQARLYLGDPQSGPLVWLFHGHPAPAGAVEPSAERPPPPHSHRTPTFRIALGEQPRQMLLNNRWYGPGEYFLLDANRRYADPSGIAGYRELLIFADRRGMHPVMKRTAGLSSDELIAWNAKLFAPLGAGLASVHTSNDAALGGISLRSGDEVAFGQAHGSLHGREGWSELSDGSRVATALMGDSEVAPAVIMSANAPGAVESPAASCGSDQFRLIVEGECAIGERRYGAGEFLAVETGTPLGKIVHGPQGSIQLLVVADRSRWAPVDERGAAVDSDRVRQITAVLKAAES